MVLKKTIAMMIFFAVIFLVFIFWRTFFLPALDNRPANILTASVISPNGGGDGFNKDSGSDFLKKNSSAPLATSSRETAPASSIAELKNNFVFWMSFVIMLALAIALLVIGFVARRND